MTRPTSVLREELITRLMTELGDEILATEIVGLIDDRVVGALGDLGDIATTPALSYRAPVLDDEAVDTLWILAFGYRLASSAGTEALADAGIPPMHDLLPGPTNEELARVAADFVARMPVPIIAQWEVARVLETLGVPRVISVEPDQADDGSVNYLSTAGVLAKGGRLAAEAGIVIGKAGVLGQADHASRCVITAKAEGLDAAIPAGVRLPSGYDPESGQPWTRSRAVYLSVDLMARTVLG